MGKSPHRKFTFRADERTFRIFKAHLALKGVSFQAWLEKKLKEELAKEPLFANVKVNEELK